MQRDDLFQFDGSWRLLDSANRRASLEITSSTTRLNGEGLRSSKQHPVSPYDRSSVRRHAQASVDADTLHGRRQPSPGSCRVISGEQHTFLFSSPAPLTRTLHWQLRCSFFPHLTVFRAFCCHSSQQRRSVFIFLPIPKMWRRVVRRTEIQQ